MEEPFKPVVKPTSDVSGIDLMDIRFPTDSLTVGTLRRRFEEMTWKPGKSMLETKSMFRDSLMMALACEQQLAAMAVCNKLGIPFSSGYSYEISRQDLITDLSKFYGDLGIADGKHTTIKLLLAFEDAAVKKYAVNRRE